MPRPLSAPDSVCDVLVVTVTYHTAALVCESLEALARERAAAAINGICVRAVIVDNDSGDVPALDAFVRERGLSDWVSVVRAERNGGFAYGCNQGIRFGFESERIPTYFYLLNPDAVVCPGAISQLVGYLQDHPRVAVAGSVLEAPNSAEQLGAFRFHSLVSEVDRALEVGLVTKLLRRHVVSRPIGRDAEHTDWVSGAAMMIRRNLIEQVGGLDEAYFLYFEETDFCRKTRSAGWDIACVPSSRVIHDAGAATGITNDRCPRRPLPGYWFESRRRFFAKSYGVPYACLTDAVFVAAFALGHIKRAVLGRTEHFPPHFLRDFLRHSVLLPRNRHIVAAAEYRPRRASASDGTLHKP